MPSSAAIYEVVQNPRVAVRAPWWLWPNILSLDAPLVALLWQTLAAKDVGVQLSIASRLALPLAVWAIYLADRLIDSVRAGQSHTAARHRYYRAHRTPALALLIAVSSLLAACLRFLPAPVLRNGLVVAAVVAAYMVTIHAVPVALRRYFPKELSVALIFAAGTTLSVWTRMHQPAPLVFPALLFALLCWLNCSAIEVWESPRDKQTGNLALRVTGAIMPVSLTVCVISLALAPFCSTHLLFLALAACALAFFWLARIQGSFNADALRVLADLPLLTPLFLLTLR